MKHQLRNKLREKAGFTLVELIVVIAILGILASIGTVAYSGYVKKARQAADNQLLVAVNTDFAAACIEQHVDAILVPDGGASLPISATGTGDLTVTNPPAGADASAISAAFDKYFAENKTTGWKYYTSLTFAGGVFHGVDSDGNVINYEELRTTLQDSSYWSNLSGTDGLTGKVDSVVNALNGAIKLNPDLIGGGGFADYLSGLGLDPQNDADTQKIANAAVLYLAQNATGMSANGVNEVSEKLMTTMLRLAYDPSADQMALINDLTTSTGSQLASYATLYAAAEGMALGLKDTNPEIYNNFVNAPLNNETQVLASVSQLLGSLVTDESGSGSDYINSYLEEGQIGKDINAYYQIMQAVDTQSGTLKLQLDTENLFTNSDLVRDIINNIENNGN